MKNDKSQKQRELIAQWRQAANEATTADSAETYKECADALEAIFGPRVLMAICEGCDAKIPMPTESEHRVYASLPDGWSQCGVSKHGITGRGVRLAAWCPACRAQRLTA